MQDLTISLQALGAAIYPESVRPIGSARLFVARWGGRKLVGLNQPGDTIRLQQPVAETDRTTKLFELDWQNYQELGRHLPSLKPTAATRRATFGTGDRLGMVTAAHLAAHRRHPVFPVLAQQSPRELERTNRSFRSVLLDAVMGALEAGYDGPFGADADHIKNEQRFAEGLGAGYSMFTLDVSDELDTANSSLSEAGRAVVEAGAGRVFGEGVTLSANELTRSALIYEKSMLSAMKLYAMAPSEIDLEISIDEGIRDTTYEDHFFVAEFLHRNDVDFRSLAPRFPGEFQKAVDFRGDRAALFRAFDGHAELARQIGGYRLSLHSGSDKFSVYPHYARATQGHFHIKTSGTSWLQAVRVVASQDRELFADMYQLATTKLPESKRAYHVDIVPGDFPEELPRDAPDFFNRPDVQQLIHISYGVLLASFGDRLRQLLRDNELLHYHLVASHIERHLELACR